MKKISISIIIILTVLYANAQGGAAINTTGTPANPSAILDLNSTTQGVLIPRMTTTERNSVSNPAIGLQIFNTDCENVNIYVSNGWSHLNQSSFAPVPPNAGINSSTNTQITWNWSNVSGATGYKFNTVNNYTTATDNGANTSYTQTGLNCNSFYMLFVWAYNPCGNSTYTSLSDSTIACPFICGTSSITFTYKNSPVTYGTITGQNNTCWLDRNLGATAVATAFNHIAGYGDLFQWGRLDDSHQTRGSNTTSTLSSSDNPLHSNFIIAPSSPYDWRNPQNNNLWQEISGINNICPANWRLPTQTELENEYLSWAPNNYNGAIASPLKFPAAGYRSCNDGSVISEGVVGNYWSTVTNGTEARYLYFSGFAGIYSDYRAVGRSARCIKD